MTENTENHAITLTLEELSLCNTHLHIVINALENLQQCCLDNEANGDKDTAEVAFLEICSHLHHLTEVTTILGKKQMAFLEARKPKPTIPPHTHTIANGKHRITK